MADMMTFPNTVEEFMEQYKITDTEQIYTNGAELVPIFRMKQWFDHKPEIIQCKDCTYGKQDDYGRWYCIDFGCQIGDEDGSGFCADAERREE